MRLDKKVAVITGAGSGIGKAITLLFAQEGARIVASDWNAETLDAVVQDVRQKGGTITGQQANVAAQAETENLIDSAVAAHGRLDILCNNAGIIDNFAGVATLTDEMWRRILSINLDGPMFACRRAVPVMRKQGGGSIINTASMAGLGGGSAGAAYTVSKHGVVGLTRSTAWIYAKDGIRCNAICPGHTETNISANSNAALDNADADGLKRAMKYIAINPVAIEPIDVAQLALFLASDESRYINGAVIPADSGWGSA